MKKKHPQKPVKADKITDNTKAESSSESSQDASTKPASGQTPAEDKKTSVVAQPSTQRTRNAKTDTAGSAKPKRWRRWIVRTSLLVIVLLFLFRLSLVWVIPVVINRAANHYDLSASVERVELSVLGTDAGLWHLKISPKEGGKELASIDYVRVKVATWALLTGNLHLRRAEAEGVTLQLHRNADGRLPLLDRVLASLPESEKKESSPSSFTLAPPLQVDALRLGNLKIEFFDEFADPSIQSDVMLNLTISDLDSPVRPTRFDVELRADPIIDFLHVKGMAHTSDQELKADLDFELRGLHPHTIAGYLQMAGLKPVAQRINATMIGQAHLTLVDSATSQPTSQPLQGAGANTPPLTAVQGRITLSDITLAADDQSAVGLEKLTLDISTLNGNLFNCALLDIEGVAGHASRNVQGNLQFAGLEVDGQSSTDQTKAPAASASTQPASASTEPSATATTTAAAKTTTTATPLSTRPSSSPIASGSVDPEASNFRWRLGGVDIRRMNLSFRDEMVKPVVDLSVALDHLTLVAPDSQAFGMATMVNITGQGSAPGLAESIEVKGEFRPFQTPLDLQANLRITHIQPTAIEPYLKMLELDSQLHDATLAMDLQASWTPDANGGVRADLVLENVKLEDQGPLFDLDRLSIQKLAIASDLKRLSVDSVEVQGTRVKAKREASGNFQMLGFRTQMAKVALPVTTDLAPAHTKPVDRMSADPAMPAVVNAMKTMAPVFQIIEPVHPQIAQGLMPVSPEASETKRKVSDEEVVALSLRPLDVLSRLPHVSIGSFSWKDLDVTWDDQMVSPVLTSHLSDAGVLLNDFVFDPASEPLSGKPASLRLWVSADDVFGNLNLTGKILAGGKGVSLHLDLLADELQSKVILPYLEPFGFEPVMQNGRLVLTGQAKIVRGPERWKLGTKLERLELTDGDEQLASVDDVELVDLTLRDGRLGAKQLLVVKPYLRAQRTEDGSFVLLGFKIHPGAQLPPPARDALTNLVETFSHIQGSVAQLKVSDATLDWQDDVVTPTFKARTIAQTSLTNFELGQKHASGQLDASLMVSDAIKLLRIEGGLSLVNQQPHITLLVTGEGLDPEQAKAYLPAGMILPWHDGRLKLAIGASFHNHDLGGHAFEVAVSEFELRNGEEDRPYVAVKDAKVQFNRYDPQGGVVDLAEISAHGFETQIHRAKDGQLTVAGVTFGSTKEVEQALLATTQPTTNQPASSQPADALPAIASFDVSTPQEATGDSASVVNTDLAAILAKRRQAAPLITLARLDLHAARISVTDEMREKSSPLVINNLSVINKDRIELLGPTAKEAPPVKLKIQLEPTPIAKAVQVDLIAKPFDDLFKFGMTLEVSGINGQGLLSVLPELAEMVKADDLVDGALTSRFGMAAKLDRVRPWQIDLSRGGVVNMGIGETSLRQSPDGLVLGGVKQIRIEDIQIMPQWKQVRIQNVDISDLVFNGWRDAQGLHLLGFTLPLKSDEAKDGAAQPDVQVKTEQSTEESQEQNAAQAVVVLEKPEPMADGSKEAGTAKPVPPAVLVELNQLTISGLEGTFEDRLTKPVTVLPLTGLDVDVRNVTNSFATQARPLRFNMLLTAGKVKVPVREQSLNVTGVLGDTARFLTGNQTKTRRVSLVERDLFSQITASGRVRFNPKPDGWVKFSINGLELWSLRGMATQFGVELGGGVMDLTVDGRIDDDGNLVTQNRLVLTDLSLREPSNGPISRYLALPAPLDAVLVAVRTSDGAITLPLNLTIRKGNVSQDEVMRQVLSAMSSVLAKAFTSSPMKIAGGVTSFVGVGSLIGSKEAKAYEPVMIAYLPGHTAPEPPFSDMLDALIKRMKSETKLNVILRSQISLSDVQTAAVRANPTRDECMEMIAELSQRVRELSFQRADVAGQVKAELASMAPELAQKSMEQLRMVDRQLVRTQEALDGVYELLRPGSPRQAMRRTRAAAIAIGQARLEYIALKMYESDIPNVLQRVQVTPSQFNPIDSSADEALGNAKRAEKAEQDQQNKPVENDDKTQAKAESDADTTSTDQNGSESSAASQQANESSDQPKRSTDGQTASEVQPVVTLDAQEDPAMVLGQVVITLVPTR